MVQKRLTNPGTFRLQQRIQWVDMRILVIEDERTLAGFIEQSLHADGYAATVAPRRSERARRRR